MDISSRVSKVGFAGDDEPRLIIPTLVGAPRRDLAKERKKKSISRPSFGKSPIEGGLVQDWGAIERLYDNIFMDLRVDSSKCPVLYSEVPLHPPKHRERIAKIMLERFKAPKLAFINSAALATYSSGRTTGLVVDIGDGICSIAPVYEGYIIEHAIMTYTLAGRDITDYLQRLMRQAGYSFISAIEKEIVRDIKEKLCYVALDPQEELKKFESGMPRDNNYTLPDGKEVHIGVERILVTECLFNPSLIGKEYLPLDDAIISVIKKCDTHTQQHFYNNIILSGGSSLFPGLKQRLQKEIQRKIPKSLKLNVLERPERFTSVWIGGSIIASLNSFNKIWVTKEEYLKKGTEVFNQRAKPMKFL